MTRHRQYVFKQAAPNETVVGTAEGAARGEFPSLSLNGVGYNVTEVLGREGEIRGQTGELHLCPSFSSAYLVTTARISTRNGRLAAPVMLSAAAT